MRAPRLLIVTAGLLAAAVAGCAGESAPPAPAPRPDISGTWVHPGGPGGASLRPADGFPVTPWAAEKMKSEKPTSSSDFRETTDPAVLYADPNGYPRIQMHPMKFKLVQTDDYVYHLWEYNQNWRQIAMNKEHSPDAPATWYGNAVGKWDGDTLVVHFTFEDPGAFTKPWSAELKYERVEDGAMIETIYTISDELRFRERFLGVPSPIPIRR